MDLFDIALSFEGFRSEVDAADATGMGRSKHEPATYRPPLSPEGCDITQHACEVEEKGSETVEREVERVERWVEEEKSGNTVFDERIRVTLEAVDEAMEFIQGGEEV